MNYTQLTIAAPTKAPILLSQKNYSCSQEAKFKPPAWFFLAKWDYGTIRFDL